MDRIMHILPYFHDFVVSVTLNFLIIQLQNIIFYLYFRFFIDLNSISVTLPSDLTSTSTGERNDDHVLVDKKRSCLWNVVIKISKDDFLLRCLRFNQPIISLSCDVFCPKLWIINFYILLFYIYVLHNTLICNVFNLQHFNIISLNLI